MVNQTGRFPYRQFGFHSFISSRHQNTAHSILNPLTPNHHYRGRTAPLTSKRCILYIYSTNIGNEYFKHGIYSSFFFSSSKCSLFHNSNVFGSCIIHILYRGDKTSVKPNDHYRGRTAPLTSKRCILYIYSTNIGTEYFKHGIYSQYFSLQTQFVS